MVTNWPTSSGLYVVALVIHDHAGTHAPVQYIQAYILILLTLYYIVRLYIYTMNAWLHVIHVCSCLYKQ